MIYFTDDHPGHVVRIPADSLAEAHLRGVVAQTFSHRVFDWKNAKHKTSEIFCKGDYRQISVDTARAYLDHAFGADIAMEAIPYRAEAE